MSEADQIAVLTTALVPIAAVLSGCITWAVTAAERQTKFQRWLVRNKLAEWRVKDPDDGEVELCKLHDSLDTLDPF